MFGRTSDQVRPKNNVSVFHSPARSSLVDEGGYTINHFFREAKCRVKTFDLDQTWKTILMQSWERPINGKTCSSNTMLDQNVWSFSRGFRVYNSFPIKSKFTLPTSLYFGISCYQKQLKSQQYVSPKLLKITPVVWWRKLAFWLYKEMRPCPLKHLIYNT